jgi:hypothetical protein
MKGGKKIERADSLTSLKSETNSQTDSLQVVTRRKSVFDCRSIQESINLLR